MMATLPGKSWAFTTPASETSAIALSLDSNRAWLVTSRIAPSEYRAVAFNRSSPLRASMPALGVTSMPSSLGVAGGSTGAPAAIQSRIIR